MSEKVLNLVCAGNVDDLNVGRVAGRADLRRINIGSNKPLLIRDKEITDADFSDSTFRNIRLVNVTIRNCIFDRCDLQSMRCWNTTVERSSFRSCNLKNATLGGGIFEGRPNIYRSCDFDSADLRDSTHFTETYEKCSFRRAKLSKIDFKGTSFVDCSFEGVLSDVIFDGKTYKNDEACAQIRNATFEACELRFCAFRRLDLDEVRFPTDKDQSVIENFPTTRDAILRSLSSDTSDEAKNVAIFLNIDGGILPIAKRRPINLRDVEKSFGRSTRDKLCDLLAGVQRHEQP